jgi:putative flippase GtrA
MIRGLGLFYASCLAGGVLNEAAATLARQLGAHWTAAALTGLVIGAVCNYVLATRFTWRGAARSAPQRAASASVALTSADRS